MRTIQRKAGYALAGLLALGVSSQFANASVTIDREYLFGDYNDNSLKDEGAGGVGDGGIMGSAAAAYDSTFDTDFEDVVNFSDSMSLVINNDPRYADVGATGLNRPGATFGNTFGASFDGVDDYLNATNLNLPDGSNSQRNYSGIVNRGYSLWVYADSSNSGNTQSIVRDSLQHGVSISDSNTWVMNYNDTVTDSGVAVNFGAWNHVQLTRTDGPGVGARLYVNGVAVAAKTGGYVTGDTTTPLTVGANNDGSGEFFKGVLDDLNMFVVGDNSHLTNGQNWGTFELAADNEYIANELAGKPAGDVDLNGVLDNGDVTTFIANWLAVSTVTEVANVGDLVSRKKGDLNMDGKIDLHDASILHLALVAAGGPGFPFSSIPEPASMSLLGLGGLMMLRRRRA